MCLPPDFQYFLHRCGRHELYGSVVVILCLVPVSLNIFAMSVSPTVEKGVIMFASLGNSFQGFCPHFVWPRLLLCFLSFKDVNEHIYQLGRVYWIIIVKCAISVHFCYTEIKTSRRQTEPF